MRSAGIAPADHRIQGHGTFPVVGPGRVATEGRESLERRVDGCGALRWRWVPERPATMLLVLDPGQDERDHEDGDADDEATRDHGKDGEVPRRGRAG